MRRLPILCGGTGLYFSALTNGIADIPDPGAAARARGAALLAELGAGRRCTRGWHAARPRHGCSRADSQRIARAWEVLARHRPGARRTGRRSRTERLPGWRFKAILLDPPREALRAAIAARFAAMLQAGRAGGGAALLALGLDPALPPMRAHGVPELAAYLRGEISLAEAAARASW